MSKAYIDVERRVPAVAFEIQKIILQGYSGKRDYSSLLEFEGVNELYLCLLNGQKFEEFYTFNIWIPRPVKDEGSATLLELILKDRMMKRIDWEDIAKEFTVKANPRNLIKDNMFKEESVQKELNTMIIELGKEKLEEITLEEVIAGALDGRLRIPSQDGLDIISPRNEE